MKLHHVYLDSLMVLSIGPDLLRISAQTSAVRRPGAMSESLTWADEGVAMPTALLMPAPALLLMRRALLWLPATRDADFVCFSVDVGVAGHAQGDALPGGDCCVFLVVLSWRFGDLVPWASHDLHRESGTMVSVL